MKRRQFITTTGAALIPVLTPIQVKSKSPVNILWIIAEDLSPDLGCYGEPVVKTPNIDKLASEGMLFENAFTTAPICSPSRSAFMTGMYQTSIGAHHHRSHRKDGYALTEPVNVITEYFRQAGYFTSNCQNLNWDRYGKTDFNFSGDGGEVTTTDQIYFDGTDWRQRKSGQPFFTQVNIFETHRDPKKSLPGHCFAKDPDNPIDRDRVELPPYYPDHPIVRQDWADYLECAQVLDNKVGQVLKRLEDDGLTENTLVFFFGDNGRPHVRGKGFLYEGGIHVPLIVRWPGKIKPGTRNADLVSAIDFAPTCMDLLDIPVPAHLQGHIFLGPNQKKRQYIFAARDRADETMDRVRCVRSKRYKYIRNFFPHIPYTQSNIYRYSMHPALTVLQVLYHEGKLTKEQAAFMAPNRPYEELYDLQNDPHELYNLAENKEHESILREFRTVLDSWIDETHDKGQIPEDPKIAAAWYLDNEPKLKIEWMQKRGLDPNVDPYTYLEYWMRTLIK